MLMRNMKEHREGGFTLVEILVGISILLILIGIAVPTFLNQRKKANDAALKAEVHNAAVEWQQDYYASMRVWNDNFVAALNTPGHTGVMTGKTNNAKGNPCIESKIPGSDQYYSYVLETKKGAYTACPAL